MSVRKAKNHKSWIVDVSNGVNVITGKRERIVRTGFNTKKAALEAEEKIYLHKFSTTQNLKRISVDYLYGLMKKEDVRNQRKASYIKSQDYNYHKHIQPYFKESILVKASYEDIECFREKLIAKKISNNTINKIILLLKKILDIAVRKKFISENPVSQLKKLKVVSKKMQFWTYHEFIQFKQLFHSDEENFLLFFTTAFYTGMRSGELLALTWQDIDFERAEITINKTLLRLNGQFIVNEPKTVSGNRKIAINHLLLEDLKIWKLHQSSILNSLAEVTADSNTQVFQCKNVLLSKDHIRKKFETVLKRDSTIKKIRIHDLRHSHVAMLIENNTPPYLIKERLGHASINTIYDFYGHLYPNRQLEAVKHLDDYY
ncbi:site-specific integrase [Enterococcus sp. HY326]|uniref:site-specific integrase n=1 Tax=Enterococcus sp. HY326 TaxID=2971265 RepID=UPI002240213A|nr:site-specific integrase [Enterococcus sp. HY326]